MKKVCIAVLLFFGAVCLKAQSLTDCENVVKETAIRSRHFAGIWLRILSVPGRKAMSQIKC